MNSGEEPTKTWRKLFIQVVGHRSYGVLYIIFAVYMSSLSHSHHRFLCTVQVKLAGCPPLHLGKSCTQAPSTLGWKLAIRPVLMSGT